MITRSAREVGEAATRFMRSVAPRISGATVVALSGDLGAGKTTFAQALARALGVEEAITSPTFTIEKIYALKDRLWQRLVHIDAYRLKGPHELEALDWREMITDPGNLVVIEWPERIAESLPEGAIRIRFDIAGEKRIISGNGFEKEGNE